MNPIPQDDPLKSIPNIGKPIPETLYKVGDPIGDKWIICGLLGKGGMGVVYYVYNRNSSTFNALKSIKEEDLIDPLARTTFWNEAELWINLERYPFIVEALWLEEVDGRPYVEMDYIPPAQGMKSSSLASYIERGPTEEKQALKWAIQFCYGMEHAYKHGIKCHRDIKPQNILIDPEGNVRISDFGLAKALDKAEVYSFDERGDIRGSLMSHSGRGGCGTPPYMPPEQFSSGEGTVKNDIYSFGVVLYEMLTGKLPYEVEAPKERTPEAFKQYWSAWERVHREEFIPDLGGEIGKVIRKCLAKQPKERYESILELQEVLSSIHQAKTGLIFKPPVITELGVVELNRRGAQLGALGRFQEAISCFNRALELDERVSYVWVNKGAFLNIIGLYHEGINCFEKALEIDPRSVYALLNMGNSFFKLQRYEEAIKSYDNALKIDPNHTRAWYNKGNVFDVLNNYEEALSCYNEVLKRDSRYCSAWNNKACILYKLRRYQEAICCLDSSLKINPLHAGAWNNKGWIYYELGRYQEAISSLQKYIEFALPSQKDRILQTQEVITQLKKML